MYNSELNIANIDVYGKCSTYTYMKIFLKSALSEQVP